MMQRLLTLVLLALAGSLTAQDVIWTEDFSRGFQGWTANPIVCGSNAGATYGNVSAPRFGVWSLQSGTENGVALDYTGLSARWTFINDTEYQFILDSEDGSAYTTVYGNYSLTEGDTLISSVAPTVALSGLEFSEATPGGLVEWASIAQLGSPTIVDFVRLHIGVGEPTVVLTDGGQTLTYTITDGANEYVFTYSKLTECGTLWAWSPNGNLGTGTFGFDAPGSVVVESDTRTNGTMVMRNIFNMFGGDASNIPSPNPPPYPSYVSELISPPIDISAADRALSLSVTQVVGYLNIPAEAPAPNIPGADGIRTSFQVSTDGGTTWSDPVDINPNFPTNTFRNSRQTVPVPLAFTEGADEIQIKLTFATDYYFWGIDDISIQERISYDMQANQNFFAVPDNLSTPWSQLQTQYFMSDIQNNGGLVADNVQLNLRITKDDTGEEVYNATKDYGNIPPDSIAENSFFDPVLDLPADPSSLGTYSGEYTIFHDSLDVVTDNDTLNFDFAVTDTLFAKEAGATRGVFFTNDRAWYAGNSYYVPNGDDWFARFVSFQVVNASDIVAAGAINSVLVQLYESDGDVDGNGRIGPEEYNNVAIAFNEYIFDGTEDDVLITIPIDLSQEGIPLNSGKYYFMVVQYPGVDDDDELAFASSEAVNYSANNFITDSIGIEQYAGVVDLTLEQPNFFSGGLGGDNIPVVRMSIGDNPDLDASPITSIETVLPDNYNVEVFPNPASDNFNLDLDFPDVQDVLIRFYDQTGRIHIQQEFDGVQNARYRYSVNTLPAGVYYIQLDTDAGTRIEKVVVQH